MTQLLQPEEIVLSNGIPVIFQPYDGLVAATYWWVQTGSADESPEEAGFAHFLEHMLFKDAAAKETGSASSGKTARAIESLGGDINAYTSFDQTVYHVTCAEQHWEKILTVFSEMGRPQKFLKEDFTREREVILEELRKNEDSPSRQLFQSLFSATYSKHPYGKPVIGYTKTLKAATVQNLETFYRRNYVSNKMGLVLVGPLGDLKSSRKKNILKILEKNFGSSLPPKPHSHKDSVSPGRRSEPAFRTKPALVKRSFDVKTPSVSFSFRVPELRHEDIPALDLLSGILSMGELSRLYQKLFYKTSLVTHVSGGLYVPKDPGMMFFQAETESVDKLNSITDEMFLEFKKMKEEAPTSEELSRVIVSAESERLYSTQTADGMASRLGFLKFVLGDLSFDQRYLEDLKKVDVQKIQEIAKQYLVTERMSGAFLVSKNTENFDLAPIEQKSRQILGQTEAKNPMILKQDRISLQPEVMTSSSGIKVIYRENPMSHVFSIHSSVLGGIRLEPQGILGSSNMREQAFYCASLGCKIGK